MALAQQRFADRGYQRALSHAAEDQNLTQNRMNQAKYHGQNGSGQQQAIHDWTLRMNLNSSRLPAGSFRMNLPRF